MNEIGITGYGCYIPRFRIKVEEIAKVWGQEAENIKRGLLVEEKSVPDVDEDTITISVEAARNALARANIGAEKIGALFIGSESHPYAVKPSGTVVAEAIGASPRILVADFEFACKAGTAAIQCCYGLVKSNEIEYGLAIGSDTSQGRPGDALEYTASAGGGAFIIGKNPVASIEGMFSYTTDTPDFWRREGEDFPRHGARFTGEPAYFRHVVEATKGLMTKLSLRSGDFDYAVFHTPNGKFPLRAAQLLGFEKEKVLPGLIVTKIGNAYSGASLLALCNILDAVAKPGQRILLTSYGSGAGSDSFSLLVTDRLLEARDAAPKTDFYVNRKSYVTYGEYVKMRKKLKGVTE
ncbi:MAG: hydroxymethylglutaryl-CoA synthase [Candidatus Aenigmarchaeota archaeon]|nr:hydroxymethylglutaryl-CoA synthase [Candidatus Aenigmarchaeota archaeon]